MSFSFGNVGKNRQQLMGLAALFIMFCHNSLYLPNWFYNMNFNYLRFLFQIGVDMFLLFSGLGCYFSLSKSESIGSFYKKRLLRLFPSYLIFFGGITIAYIFVDRQNLFQKMYSYSPLSFIVSEDLTLWFIPAICILYFISPLIFQVIKKINRVTYIFLGILAVYVLTIILQVFSVRYSNILLLRIPSFLFGMLIAYCESNSKIKKFKAFDTALLFSTFVITLILYFLLTKYKIITSRVVFFPLCVSLTVIIASIIPRRSVKLLSFLGTITLETYLVHVPILGVTDFISYRYIPSDLIATWFSNICAVILSVVVAFAINILSKKMFLRSK